MSGKLTLNNGLNINGYVSLYGEASGLVLRNQDNTDFGGIIAQKFYKSLGSGRIFNGRWICNNNRHNNIIL